MPNENFNYSNLGYVLLGQIIENISGLRYENYIRANILQPLDIRPEELGFEIADLSRQAKGYQKNWSALNIGLGFFIDKAKFMGNVEGKWKPFNSLYINGTSYGGLIGTPDAFVTYIQELLNPDSKLISKDLKKMLFMENFTNDRKSTGMCLSWFKGDLHGVPYFAHAGGGGGYYCEVRIYPEKGMGSVIMFNRSGVSDERFLDKLDQYYFEKNFENHTMKPSYKKHGSTSASLIFRSINPPF